MEFATLLDILVTNAMMNGWTFDEWAWHLGPLSNFFYDILSLLDREIYIFGLTETAVEYTARIGNLGYRDPYMGEVRRPLPPVPSGDTRWVMDVSLSLSRPSAWTGLNPLDWNWGNEGPLLEFLSRYGGIIGAHDTIHELMIDQIIDLCRSGLDMAVLSLMRVTYHEERPTAGPIAAMSLLKLCRERSGPSRLLSHSSRLVSMRRHSGSIVDDPSHALSIPNIDDERGLIAFRTTASWFWSARYIRGTGEQVLALIHRHITGDMSPLDEDRCLARFNGLRVSRNRGTLYDHYWTKMVYFGRLLGLAIRMGVILEDIRLPLSQVELLIKNDYQNEDDDLLEAVHFTKRGIADSLGILGLAALDRREALARFGYRV